MEAAGTWQGQHLLPRHQGAEAAGTWPVHLQGQEVAPAPGEAETSSGLSALRHPPVREVEAAEKSMVSHQHRSLAVEVETWLEQANWKQKQTRREKRNGLECMRHNGTESLSIVGVTV